MAPGPLPPAALPGGRRRLCNRSGQAARGNTPPLPPPGPAPPPGARRRLRLRQGGLRSRRRCAGGERLAPRPGAPRRVGAGTSRTARPELRAPGDGGRGTGVAREGGGLPERRRGAGTLILTGRRPRRLGKLRRGPPSASALRTRAGAGRARGDPGAGPLRGAGSGPGQAPGRGSRRCPRGCPAPAPPTASSARAARGLNPSAPGTPPAPPQRL